MKRKIVKKEVEEVKKEVAKEIIKEVKYVTLELVRDDLGINIPKGETITQLSEERAKLLLNHNLIKEV